VASAPDAQRDLRGEGEPDRRAFVVTCGAFVPLGPEMGDVLVDLLAAVGTKPSAALADHPRFAASVYKLPWSSN
jgi:hypothetical protein